MTVISGPFGWPLPPPGYTCPACLAAVSDSRWIHDVAVCNNCGRAIAVVTDPITFVESCVVANASHLDRLTSEEIRNLQTHRIPFRRRRVPLS